MENISDNMTNLSRKSPAKSINWIVALVLFGCTSCFATDTYATGLESMQQAQNLGDVIASEELCGLKYDQDAIKAYVSKNISDSDMEFSGLLQSMTQLSIYQSNKMSPSAKTAHCAQITRVARSYGFVK